MSYTMWAEYFNPDSLTDYATVKWEEDLYTTSVIDISNELNPVIQSRLVSKENFVLPSEAYLLVDYQLLKDDNGAYAATDNIALINNWSLFRKAELYYNGVNMETVDYPGIASQMMGILEDPEDYKSKGSLEHRFYDTNNKAQYLQNDAPYVLGTSDAVVPLPVTPAAAGATVADVNSYLNLSLNAAKISESNSNKGQAARLERANPSNTDNWIKLRLSDVFGVCKVRKPLRGIQIEVRLTVENNWNRALLRGPAVVYPATTVDRAISAKGKAIVKKASLVMPSAKAHLEVFKEINEKLVGGTAIPLNYQRIWCNIIMGAVGGGGTVQYSQRLLSNTKRPRHVFVALQSKTRHTPDPANGQLENGLLFDLPSVVRGYIQIGNNRYPNLEYDSSQDGFVRMFNAFLNSTGKNDDALASSFLDFNKWKQLYPIMYFDCSHNDNQFELSMDSEITVNLNLTGAPENFNLVALVVSDEGKQVKEVGQVVEISTMDPQGLKY